MLSPYAVFNGLAPDEAPKAAYVSVDLSVNTLVALDFGADEARGGIEFIQTVHINNATGAQAVTITAGITQQSYTVAAGKQAILPLFLPLGAGVTFTVPAAMPQKLGVTFLNVPLASIVF